MPRLRWPSTPSYESLSLLKTRSYQPHFAALRVLEFTQDSFLSTQLCSVQLIHWLIDWLIDSSFFTVPRMKYSSSWAKILKIFLNIDFMEAHHISKAHVCIYLSHLTIKEIMSRIWYMFWNIHQGLNKNPKIMKKMFLVAERDTNNHKYRLFPILP